MEQLAIPGLLSSDDRCEHELRAVPMNDGGTNVKSLCDVTGAEVWTNCREWGRCTLVGDVFGGVA